jgi:anthranilate/para-aminobenzoate synthase component II
LRQYLAPYKARQSTAASARRREAARSHEENDRLAYDRYRRQAAGALFHSLPAGEQETIERLAERSTARFDGSLRASMRGVYRAQIAAQRHPDAIKTLEGWKVAA